MVNSSMPCKHCLAKASSWHTNVLLHYLRVDGWRASAAHGSAWMAWTHLALAVALAQEWSVLVRKAVPLLRWVLPQKEQASGPHGWLA